MTDSETLAEAVHRLVTRFAPQRIVLFGSRARGDFGESSDYDLLVVVDGEPDVWALAGEMRWSLRPLRASFDIVVEPLAFWQASCQQVTSMEHQIAREGRVLHSRET